MSSERASSRKRTSVLTAAGLLAVAGLAGAALVAAGDGDTSARDRSNTGACDQSTSRKVTQPTPAQLAAAGLGRLPIAPRRDRVDLVAPPFSNPTHVTNPLFPIAALHSAVLNGQVDGKPFRTETTLLPQTRIMEWTDRQCVEVLVSQYVAYSDGRIEEVALDLYAQDDQGSVWYLGEDVFNYKDGVIADTGGTWFAGQDGPAALIMPAAPKTGDVYRPENIAGLVFEEVTVKAVGQTVDGPGGPVSDAIVVEELHDDGSRERQGLCTRLRRILHRVGARRRGPRPGRADGRAHRPGAGGAHGVLRRCDSRLRAGAGGELEAGRSDGDGDDRRVAVIPPVRDRTAEA